MNIKIMSVLLMILFSLLLLSGCDDGHTVLTNVTITGHVQDFLSGAPLNNASIYINSILKDTTDSSGNFQFRYYLVGDTVIRITKTGYFAETKEVVATGDDELILPTIRLMDSYQFSGSISGNIMLGNFNITSDNNPIEDVKVMATYKDPDSSTYWILSDISYPAYNGNYYLEHVNIDEPLTVIALLDDNNNNIIDAGEFFGEHYTPVPTPLNLNPYQHLTGVDILMTADRLSVQSAELKITKIEMKGE